jgi:TetR/AcrR family transcriptional repressor of nem operon
VTSPPDAETKEAIVLAAFECTVRLGIDGLRLRHVAAEAGMDETTLRQHFPTQRDLVSALIEDITLQFAATTRTTEGTPAERLRAHLEALSRTVRDRPALFLVLAELEVRARRDPLVRSAVERDEQGCRAWLAELFREGAGQGVWAEGVDPESAVELVLTVFKGIRVAPGGADAALMQLEHVLTRA